MLQRPLILKLLALYLFLDPLIRAAFISIETEFSFMRVLTRTFSLDLLNIFNFWCLFPLSGILLLSVKPVGYLFYIITQAYSLYLHWNYQSYNWPYLAQSPFITAYILLAVNLGFVMYLLLPGSRVVFFDKNIRWWERGSRFVVDTPCLCQYENREVYGHVKDLAKSGALISSDEMLDLGSMIKLDFEVLNKNFMLDAKVVRKVKREDIKSQGYGVQFVFSSSGQKIKFKSMMMLAVLSGEYKKFR